MIIYNVNIVTSERIIESGTIEIENGLIKNISDSKRNNGDVDGNGLYLMPGFIDIHTHGGYGRDFSEIDSIDYICRYLTKEGITTVCPTTITDKPENIINTLKSLNEYNNTGSKVAGIHLEGPFLNIAKKGAHKEEYLIEPSSEMFDLKANNVKVVSYAIEKDVDYKFLNYLNSNNIVSSVAHSNALAIEVNDAVNHGLKSVTHLFNGQSGVSHRDGGVALAGLVNDELYVEVIADFIHIEKEALQLVYKSKNKHKIILITDSMQAKGMKDGNYKLGELDVEVKNGSARLKSGSLAGSVLTMNRALRNFKEATHCTMSELVLFSSKNPARLLGIDNKVGDIQVGLSADLVLLDEEFNIKKVFINGKVLN